MSRVRVPSPALFYKGLQDFPNPVLGIAYHLHTLKHSSCNPGHLASSQHGIHQITLNTFWSNFKIAFRLVSSVKCPSGFGVVGMFLVIYAGVLAFFLPFYVMGIYNQAKKINKNLQTMISLSAKG